MYAFCFQFKTLSCMHDLILQSIEFPSSAVSKEQLQDIFKLSEAEVTSQSVMLSCLIIDEKGLFRVFCNEGQSTVDGLEVFSVAGLSADVCQNFLC